MPMETADGELIDTLLAVKLYIFLGSRPPSPASLTPEKERVASVDMMARLESQVGDVLAGGWGSSVTRPPSSL